MSIFVSLWSMSIAACRVVQASLLLFAICYSEALQAFALGDSHSLQRLLNRFQQLARPKWLIQMFLETGGGGLVPIRYHSIGSHSDHRNRAAVFRSERSNVAKKLESVSVWQTDIG
jgi:hypothetical protein